MGDGGPLDGFARREAAGAALGGGLWIALLYAPLLSPGRLLATRDALTFHLPLRLDLVRLAADGVPWWNPWLNGGQPLLSNPNYAAFYPFTWLAAVVPAHQALGLAVVLHAALAFAGGWLLLRRLGGGPVAAAMAALSLSGGGAFLSFVHVAPGLGALAWAPWAALAADLAFAAPAGRWWRPAAGCALALALAFLAGDPVCAAMAALVVACLALPHLRRAPAAVAARLAAIAAVTVLLAAVQLLPTAVRVAGSERSAGLAAEEAMDWSTRPLRLVEAAYPHAFGDPTEQAASHYAGWALHDRSLPFLVAIFPGLALLVVGLGALATRLPRRSAWAVAGGLGLLLALGRHLPLYPALHAVLPGFSALRYPERFLLLPLVALAVAGALGWHRLLAERERAPRGPLVVSVAVLVTTAAAAVWVSVARTTLWERVAAGSPLPVGPDAVDALVGSLTAGAWRATLLAAAVCALVVLARVRAVRRDLLAVAVVALLASDLWLHGRGVVRTMDAAPLAAPPPLARAVLAAAGEAGGAPRAFVDGAALATPRLFVAPVEEPTADLARRKVARLEPYSGNLWGIAHALNPDYDRMLTDPARRARELLVESTALPDGAARVIGAWDVGTLVVAGDGGAARPVVSPYRLSRLRLVPEVRFHADPPAAAEALAAQGWDVAARDHWLGAADGVTAAGERHLTASSFRAGEVHVAYRAAAPVPLVVAVTYDDGWTARRGGRPLAVHETALGQLGVVLPAGEGEVVLAYRDRSLLAGAAVTLATLAALAAALAAAALRRRRPPPAGEAARP